MRLFARLGTAGLLLFWALMALAQNTPYAWSTEFEPKDPRAGEAARVILTLKMDPGWHTYQLGQKGGPMGVGIKLTGGAAEDAGDAIGPKPIEKFDDAFKVKVGLYEKLAKFALPIRIKEGVSGPQSVTVTTKTQVCDIHGCLRPKTEEHVVKFTVAPGEARVDHIATDERVPDQPAQQGAEGAATAAPKETGAAPVPTSLWGIFVAGFLGGILSLLTPCVFPMIPVTISFFSKQGDDRGAHIRAALLYCLGIIVSFTTIGLIVTAALGKNGTYILANNVWINGALFLLFIGLALSLFGVFELILPSGLLTKVTGASRKGGAIAAPLLMGLTFALTSFTCTVPIVGTLLAGAATGDRIYPMVGMLGFSSALAAPFLGLAMFPSLMKKLPKSGGWMVTAKAFMGFLELAAALKFLSNIDLVSKAGLLTRPVFLAIWAAIWVMAGLHLFGWIRLPHDVEGKIGPTRRLFGLVSVAAGLMCLAGLNGVSLGRIQGLLPPDDYPYRDGSHASKAKAGQAEWIVDDFPKALELSKSTGKPILVDFTGHT